jgi:hypothetical protein
VKGQSRVSDWQRRKARQSGMAAAAVADATCGQCQAPAVGANLYQGWCFDCVRNWGHPDDIAELDTRRAHGWTAADQMRSMFDMRELSHRFTRFVGFSVVRRDYTNRGLRSNAIAHLLRQLPDAQSWSDERVGAIADRLCRIDGALVTLRRHVRLLHGGTRADRDRERRERRLAA